MEELKNIKRVKGEKVYQTTVLLPYEAYEILEALKYIGRVYGQRRVSTSRILSNALMELVDKTKAEHGNDFLERKYKGDEWLPVMRLFIRTHRR